MNDLFPKDGSRTLPTQCEPSDSPAAKLAAAIGVSSQQLAKEYYPGTDPPDGSLALQQQNEIRIPAAALNLSTDSPAAKLAAAIGVSSQQLAKEYYPGTDPPDGQLTTGM